MSKRIQIIISDVQYKQLMHEAAEAGLSFAKWAKVKLTGVGVVGQVVEVVDGGGRQGLPSPGSPAAVLQKKHSAYTS